MKKLMLFQLTNKDGILCIKKMLKKLGILGECKYVDNMFRYMDQSMNNISNMIPNIKKNNPGLVEEILNILKGE